MIGGKRGGGRSRKKQQLNLYPWAVRRMGDDGLQLEGVYEVMAVRYSGGDLVGR